MKRIKIAVIVGGDSSEREISLRSGSAIFDSLDRAKYDPVIVDISARGWFVGAESVTKNDFSYSGGKFDYALISIHGTPGENGILQGYFDLVHIPYSSCSVGVSALTFNKTICKAALAQTDGIYLSKEVVIYKGDVVESKSIVEKLGLPMFVKPNESGSSCGVTKVKSEGEILAAIELAFSESDVVLCEEFIGGIEISQGVMICSGVEYVLPITELVSHNEFFDYQAKYTAKMTDEITPARLPSDVAHSVSRTTLAVYKRLQCRGVVRVDYIVRDGKPYFIEVNAVPGMSKASIVPQQWAAMGMTMGEGFDKIIADTLQK